MEEATAERLIDSLDRLDTQIADLEIRIKNLLSAIDHEELGLIPALNTLTTELSLQN